jgi:hypothetical protein
MTLEPPLSQDDESLPPPMIESETLASSPPEPASRPDVAAKWFVVAFLVVVPVLGFVLLGAICYSLWRAFFA